MKMVINQTEKLYIVYGCIGENEEFRSWETAAYKDKKLAEKHKELAEKALFYIKRDFEEEYPDTTPFDHSFHYCHEHLDAYYSHDPSDLVSYYVGSIQIWTEKSLLKAIGQSWKKK